MLGEGYLGTCIYSERKWMQSLSGVSMMRAIWWGLKLKWLLTIISLSTLVENADSIFLVNPKREKYSMN